MIWLLVNHSYATAAAAVCRRPHRQFNVLCIFTFHFRILPRAREHQMANLMYMKPCLFLSISPFPSLYLYLYLFVHGWRQTRASMTIWAKYSVIWPGSFVSGKASDRILYVELDWVRLIHIGIKCGGKMFHYNIPSAVAFVYVQNVCSNDKQNQKAFTVFRRIQLILME